jgi:hypothetical protein
VTSIDILKEIHEMERSRRDERGRGLSDSVDDMVSAMVSHRHADQSKGGQSEK